MYKVLAITFLVASHAIAQTCVLPSELVGKTLRLRTKLYRCDDRKLDLYTFDGKAFTQVASASATAPCNIGTYDIAMVANDGSTFVSIKHDGGVIKVFDCNDHPLVDFVSEYGEWDIRQSGIRVGSFAESGGLEIFQAGLTRTALVRELLPGGNIYEQQWEIPGGNLSPDMASDLRIRIAATLVQVLRDPAVTQDWAIGLGVSFALFGVAACIGCGFAMEKCKKDDD